MNLYKSAGVAGLVLALIYVVAFIYFGAFWSFPADGSSAEKIAYLADNRLSFSGVYLLMYVVFGVVLSVLVAGLHERLKSTGHRGILVGSMFGAIWVGLVIASGMITTIGLAYVIDYGATDADAAYEVWRIVSLITESIGGGNELVGGLWVLLVSICALAGGVFSKPLNRLGCLVGACGIATVYPAEVLTAVFGLSQIVWFAWVGVVLWREGGS